MELIGVVGWQDILLPPWTYLVLTVAMLIVPLERLALSSTERARVALIAGVTALAYISIVYLIFYLTYTPVDMDHVRGVQGRYFAIALPVATIFIAAVCNIGLPRGVLAATAITGSLLSGISTFEALLAAHWLMR